MKIVVDENMPFVQDMLRQIDAEVLVLPGRLIRSEHVKDADALLIRSVTKVNETLIAGSTLKFIGSATIGVDHIDLPLCQQMAIKVSASPGCNADAVADYILCALLQHDVEYLGKQVGVVGLGNVGSQVARRLQSLGASVIGFDPFKEHPDITSVALDELLARCDIVCLHAPHTKEGVCPSFHMLDHRRLSLLRDQAVLINAGRGEVVDEQALLDLLRDGKQLTLMLDVWENEPAINIELMHYCALATGHIAGYSLRGKQQGSMMVMQALFRFFNITEEVEMPVLASYPLMVSENDSKGLKQASLQVYDIKQDDQRFRTMMHQQASGQLSLFDQYRKYYPVRNEFVQYHSASQFFQCAGFSDVSN